MTRKHTRFGKPDKGRRKTSRQNYVPVSSADSSSKQSKLTTKFNTDKVTKPRAKMNSIQPPLYKSVIFYTLKSVCLFSIIIIQPSYQQQNTQLCPKVCTCDEQSLEVSCNGPFDASGLPHTLNPATKRITIVHGSTTHITSSDLDYFRDLEELKIAVSKLTTLDFDHIKSNQNLVSFNASHNNIVELKDSAVMMVISKLSSSNLSSSLSSITDSDEYKKLRRSKINVVELDVSYNQLVTLKNFTFMRWHRLQRLYLSHNSIEILEHESLFGLSKLEHLNLRGNRLTQIHVNAIHFSTRSLGYMNSEQTTTALETIDLSENPLMSIEAGSFNSLNRVRELYLESCLISRIDLNAFTGLTSVTVISLASNELVDIPTEALAPITTLKTLKLNSNDIQILRPYAFKNLYNLENLQLSNGSLVRIEDFAFYGLTSLRELQLDFNHNLTKIGSTLFDDLPRLSYLSVQMGSLASLSANENIAKHSLSILDLRGNPFVCDCNLKWLTNTLKRLNESLISSQQDKTGVNLKGSFNHNITVFNQMINITCFGPSALIGKQIYNLPDNKLECLRPNSKLNVHIGFASLFFMILTLTTVCLINFCRDEKHLMVILKENIVNNRISMILPYGHDAHKSTDNYSKETQFECSDYEPIDYEQNHGPIYTLPGDQYMDDPSARQQQTQQL